MKSVAPEDYVGASHGPTLHVLGLPHTQTVKDGYETCAYTQKVVKFCDMMAPTHRVILYSGDLNDADCAEHVSLFTEAEREADFGPGYDPVLQDVSWDTRVAYWRRFNERAVKAVKERAEPQDLLLLTTSTHKPVLSGTTLLGCEWAVGYEGIATAYRVFESHAWRHYLYGRYRIDDGAAFDAVIPNFFDEADFSPSFSPGEDLLFLGRLIARKGPHVAAEISKRTGRKLYVAGPGAQSWQEGRVVCLDGTILEAPGLEYLGVLGRQERAERLAAAGAVLLPTLYIEPFGGVAVEAMLSGTPVVASDWGAFTETVEDGITGARFSTLAQGAAAVERAIPLERVLVRSRSFSRFTFGPVSLRFADYFQQLLTLWREGWYA